MRRAPIRTAAGVLRRQVLAACLVVCPACDSSGDAKSFLDRYQARACARFAECGISDETCAGWLVTTGYDDAAACWSWGEYNPEFVDNCWDALDDLTCEDAESYVDRGWSVPYCDMALAGCLPDSGGG